MNLQAYSSCCVARHTIVVAREGVFAWGNNTEGQLGVGDFDTRFSPTLLPDVPNFSPSSLHLVYCAMSETYAVTKEGELWGWGAISRHLLGLGEGEVLVKLPTPQPLPGFGGKKISSFSAGYNFTLALTEDGKVYSWGSNRTGQLGRETDMLYLPAEVCGFEDKIISVAAGVKHAVAVDEQGNLWVWGDVPMSSRNNPIKTPKEIAIPEFTKFSSLACGIYFSGALSDTGELYFWGKRYGQAETRFLGITDTPRKFSKPGEKITKFVCGIGFAIWITEAGKVYANGVNNLGQLGLGHESEILEPSEIPTEFGKISSITCLANSSFIFTNSGEIFGCGWNKHGILGLGDEVTRSEFQKLPCNFTPKIFAVYKLFIRNNFSQGHGNLELRWILDIFRHARFPVYFWKITDRSHVSFYQGCIVGMKK
jgi:alpha-tubulin suppressor-like RCC1 family protein